MNRYRQSVPRAEFVRQRRSGKKTQSRRGTINPVKPTEASTEKFSLSSLFLPTQPKAQTQRREMRNNTASRNQYQYAYTGNRTQGRGATIQLPAFNMRWVSAVLSAGLLFAIYAIWNSPSFTIQSAEVSGNLHISAEEIYFAMDMDGEPVFKAVPAEMTENLRKTMPELETAVVRVLFPNRIVVQVAERIPVLDWYTFRGNGEIESRRLIDINGVDFTPREGVEGLIVVYATGTPPEANPGEDVGEYETPYITPEVVHALVTLLPYVPADIPVAYDPEYGIGWEDARGWQVFFGMNTNAMELRIAAYQSIIDELTRKGIQPELISMAYLETPFIK